MSDALHEHPSSPRWRAGWYRRRAQMWRRMEQKSCRPEFYQDRALVDDTKADEILDAATGERADA